MASKSDLSAEERRNWPRHGLDSNAHVTLDFGGETVTARIEDISLGGVRLLLEGHAPSKSPVVVHREGDRIFEGDSVWENGYEIGIRFKVPESEVEHLLQCIRLVLSTSAAANKSETGELRADLIPAKTTA